MALLVSGCYAAPLLPETLPPPHQPPLVLFWHVHNKDEVVLSQRDRIMGSEAYRQGLQIRFVAQDACVPTALNAAGVSLRAETKNTDYPSLETLATLRATPQFEQVQRPAGTGCENGVYQEFFEAPTQLALHQHCLSSPPGSLVAYAHTKTLDEMRNENTDFLLQEPNFSRCVGELRDGSVACGINPREPLPGPCKDASEWEQTPWSEKYTNEGCGATWCHFSGNFWWARCDYVSLLNPPISLEDTEIAQAVGSPMYGWWGDVRPSGRYFHEWWLLNDLRRPWCEFWGGCVYEHGLGNTTFVRQARMFGQGVLRSDWDHTAEQGVPPAHLTPAGEARWRLMSGPAAFSWPAQCAAANDGRRIVDISFAGTVDTSVPRSAPVVQ